MEQRTQPSRVYPAPGTGPQSRFRAQVLADSQKEPGAVDVSTAYLQERRGYSARAAAKEAEYARIRAEGTLWGQVKLWWRQRSA